MATIPGTPAGEVLVGTALKDTIIGDGGNDTMLGGAGNDLFLWEPGDGNDVVEGETDLDTLRFTGSNAFENVDISANGARARLFRDVGAVTMDLDDVERIDVRALGGADNIVVSDLTGTDVTMVSIDLASTAGGKIADASIDTVTVVGTNAAADGITISSVGSRIVTSGLQASTIVDHASAKDVLVVNGLGGDDVINASKLAAGKITLQIFGGIGADTIIGSAGSDVVTGDGHDDRAMLGAGNDRFVWSAGHGNDTVEGGAGTDTLQFNATPGIENFDISAAGSRARLTRNVGNVTMDLNDVERIELAAQGGTDTIAIGDLTGTDIKLVAIDLAAAGGGGDAQPDVVTRNGREASDIIKVGMAGAAVSITGLSAQVTIANAEAATDQLVVNGKGGNDTINASALPAAAIHLTLDGGSGNDVIVGNDGANVILGGDGNDTVAGDGGDDVAFLGAGNDTFIWTPGDGNDTVEGQDGTDTLRFTGSGAGESFDIFANGGRSLVLSNLGPAVMDMDDVERIHFRALGGADTVVIGDLTGTDVVEVQVDLAAAAGGVAPDNKIDTVTANGTNGDDLVLVASAGSKITATGLQAKIIVDHAGKTDVLTINGGDGNDVIDAAGLAPGKIALKISGGLGTDVMIGSAGNDTVTGGDGNDVALLDAGNDQFIWNPGDDNDRIEGQAGTDTLLFNGSNGAESISISANGERTRLFRDIASVTMDLNDVERIQLNALGGADILTINDLSGTDVKVVAIDLGIGGTGDLQPDKVTRDGSNGNDAISVAFAGGIVSVAGLSAQVTIANVDFGTDRLTVNALAGNDKIDGTKLAGAMQLILDGGAGNDAVAGSAGADTLIGGDGNDTINAAAGSDIVFGGIGNDLFLWGHGGGNDIFEGQGDFDTLRFTGWGASESFDIAANGGRVVVFRDVGAVTTDLDDFERLELRALGGADNIVVGDLTGTDVTQVVIDLAATAGGKTADSSSDRVTVNGTNGGDVVTVTSAGSTVSVAGLASKVSIDHAGKTDVLVLSGLDGVDTIDASALAAGKIAIQMFGGLGTDIFLGSAGNDTVTGGDGDDIALLGAGNDLFIWNPGDDNDTVEGQTGIDTLSFNGAAVAEIINISANGTRAQFFRDVANVTTDLDDVERIRFQALGGIDNVTVNDLAATDVRLVAIDLAGLGGGGDGSLDTVLVQGTGGNDKVTLSASAGVVSVSGLAAQVTVAYGEASDRLVLFGNGGNDAINAAGVPGTAMALTIEGGAGKDTIAGGGGHDLLNGGDDNDALSGNGGDDFMIGALGRDTLNGGSGDDIMDGGADDDVVNGSTGNDQLFGGLGNDKIDGATGNDQLFGGDGNDKIDGGSGHDIIIGGAGNDTINVSAGNDTVRYSQVVDGHDLIVGFDGNAAGGQDVVDLELLFDALGIPAADRDDRVSISDLGSTVTVGIDTDGNLGNGPEVSIALKTIDAITIGQDVLLGN